MIDFGKKLAKENASKTINPVELYNDLDRSSKTGSLRPVQEKVLKEWFENRINDKDIIVKLHTGEGKSLIGLLMLQSKLHMGEGPCMYICPNKFLADQAFYEAKKFGIKVCLIDENNTFPNDFIEGKTILLTTVQKVFNGKTIFGLDNQYKKIKTLVMDDAHACLDAIKQAYTIKISRRDNLKMYNHLLELFEESLKEQGEGTFIDIKNNFDYESVLMIPYWDWINKKSEIINILSIESDETYLKFIWGLLRDEIDRCDAYVNGKEVQIIPHTFDVGRFGSFDKAAQRILMSATTQDDIFFVKNFNFSIEAINNPIQCLDKKWSGEKMIIIPSLINDELNRVKVIDYLCKFNWNKFGVCSLVPSWEKQKDYENLYCTLLDKENIFNQITNRQDGKYGKTLVITNRYDGIDLPDDACRIMILDSLPNFANMSDIYEEKGRIDCELIRRKIAQKIEQGLGRCVRGEKDYSCIFIIGPDLVKFLMSIETREYFSPQTRKQIEIGLNIAKMSAEDISKKDEKYLLEFIKQSINRDEGWKEYYKSEMDQIHEKEYVSNREALIVEKKSEDFFIQGNYDKSVETLQNYIDKAKLSKEDRGWYLQQMARRIYLVSRVEADKLQHAAFDLNRQLLKPQGGVNYIPLEKVNVVRANNIKKFFNRFGTYEELNLVIQDILNNLSIGVKAEKFEDAMDQIGKLLGFDCHRPDNLIRKGPDNLWHVGKNKYIMLECKSEVRETREYISKSEVGQMENHCGWFEEEYHDAEVLNILVIVTNKIAQDANFSHDVRIMRKKNIEKLKNNILKFVKEFRKYDIQNLTEEFIYGCLKKNDLSDDNIWNDYAELWKRYKG